MGYLALIFILLTSSLSGDELFKRGNELYKLVKVESVTDTPITLYSSTDSNIEEVSELQITGLSRGHIKGSIVVNNSQLNSSDLDYMTISALSPIGENIRFNIDAIYFNSEIGGYEFISWNYGIDNNYIRKADDDWISGEWSVESVNIYGIEIAFELKNSDYSIDVTSDNRENYTVWYCEDEQVKIAENISDVPNSDLYETLLFAVKVNNENINSLTLNSRESNISCIEGYSTSNAIPNEVIVELESENFTTVGAVNDRDIKVIYPPSSAGTEIKFSINGIFTELFTLSLDPGAGYDGTITAQEYSLSRIFEVENSEYVEDTTLPTLSSVENLRWSEDDSTFLVDIEATDDNSDITISIQFEQGSSFVVVEENSSEPITVSLRLSSSSDMNITQISVSDGQNSIYYSILYPDGGVFNEITYEAIDSNWTMFLKGTETSTEDSITVSADVIRNIDEAPTGSWTLLGSSETIDDLRVFENIDLVWTFKESSQSWQGFSGTEKFNISDNGIETIESIPAYRGFWIQK